MGIKRGIAQNDQEADKNLNEQVNIILIIDDSLKWLRKFSLRFKAFASKFA